MWAKMYAGETSATVQQVTLGRYDVVCPNANCGAVFWEAERLCGREDVPYWCCGRQVKTRLSELGAFRPIQDERVLELYQNESEDSKHFLANLTAYNSILSTALPVVKYASVSLKQSSVVTVNGKLTFRAPSLPNFDAEGLPSTYGQLYFVEMSREQVQKRIDLARDQTLRPHIVALLESYLRRHNDFVRTFKYAAEIQSALEERQDAGSSDAVTRVSVLVNPHRDGFRVTDR
jgi:hypothetical protein